MLTNSRTARVNPVKPVTTKFGVLFVSATIATSKFPAVGADVNVTEGVVLEPVADLDCTKPKAILR